MNNVSAFEPRLPRVKSHGSSEKLNQTDRLLAGYPPGYNIFWDFGHKESYGIVPRVEKDPSDAVKSFSRLSNGFTGAVCV